MKLNGKIFPSLYYFKVTKKFSTYSAYTGSYYFLSF